MCRESENLLQYLAASLAIDDEYITALDGVSTASDIRNFAFLISFRKADETRDVAEFANSGLRVGVCAHVDCTETILEDVVMRQVKIVAFGRGRNNGIVPCSG